MGSLSVENLQLQEMAFNLVAFMGVIRRTKNYDLRWEEFVFHESKHKIFVRVQQIDGKSEGQVSCDFDVLTRITKIKA